ncbi:MAG: beta-ketoacyl synthase N-terminal-like domain-containing protein [Caulobacterales bacterium]
MAARGAIAIAGLSIKSAAGMSTDAFWALVKQGRDRIGELARVDEGADADGPGHWVEVTPEGDEDEFFDAGLFGLSPKEADTLEPQHRAFLGLAFEALEDGGWSRETCGRRVGVFAGGGFTSYFAITPTSFLPDALPEILGADKDYLATRVAHHLGLTGPAITVQSACSTSLVAVHLACQSLRSGECDAAIAGGVSLTRPRMSRYFYLPGGLLSPDGHCRAFDAEARGTVFSEGVGAVLLMRLEDALKRGHPIYAVIRGSAVNNDGGGKASFMAPSIAGQERVICAALRSAGVSAGDLGYVEAHGTATVLGDAIELAALTKAFRGDTDEVGFCQLGSVKPNIGHVACAAGVAGVIKLALALKHGLRPPSANFRSPNPDYDPTTSPFYFETELRDWPRGEKPRRAGVSSFGVGGTNAHAILEEAPRVRASRAQRTRYVITLSAKNEAALAGRAEGLRARLKGRGRRELADIAYTTNAGRSAMEMRAAVVCATPAEARRGLKEGALSARSPARERRTIGFLLPGQGAQQFGMGAGLYNDEPAYRRVVDECLTILKAQGGPDLTPMLTRHGDAAESDAAAVNQTSLAQPALFIVELGLGRLLLGWGVRPDYALGHSVGEFAAACLANVLSLEDALRLVALRGALMQQMRPGAMISVAAAPEDLKPLLIKGLDVAAVNGPRACVLAGPEKAITAMEERLAGAKIPAVRLRTSHAFHSRMMAPMLAHFRELVASVHFSPPEFPLVSNLTGEMVSWPQLTDPDYWTSQIRRPVMFAKGLETLILRGVDMLVEVGPGRQLSALAQQAGLHRQGVPVITTLPLERRSGSEDEALLRALGQIWTEGGRVDWLGFHLGERRRMVALPSYPFQRERYRVDALPASAASRLQGKLPLEAWLNVPTWRRVVRLPARSPQAFGPSECWLVFAADEAAGASIAQRLAAAGDTVVCVRAADGFARLSDGRFTVDPAELNDYERLFAALKSEDLTPRRILHTWSLEAEDTGDEGDSLFERRQRLGLFSLLKIHGAFRRVFDRAPLAFEIVTSGLFEVTALDRLRPGLASILAFANVGPQEQPNLSCRVMDVIAPRAEDGACNIAADVAETVLRPSERILALRGGYWWRQEFERIEPQSHATGPAALKTGGVYLITGGLGHIGMILARHLASRWTARLVLAGRSEVPLRGDWDRLLEDAETPPETGARIRNLMELENLGAEVLYVSADVAVLEDVQRLRGLAFERFGAVDGVIFGAGCLDSVCAISEVEDLKSYHENFAPKVTGLKNVVEVFAGDPLDFGVVLSSVSALLGGLGYCAYSAANLVADRVVLEQRQRPDSRWTTINWDLWAGGSFSGDRARQLGRLLMLAIQPTEGARALEAVLGLGGPPQVIVSTHELAPRIEIAHRGLTALGTAGRSLGDGHQRPAIATAFVEPEGETEAKLADIWKGLLGVDKVGRDDDFFDLGGHSLLALYAAYEVQAAFPDIKASFSLYDHPTVRKLAEAFQSESGASAAETAGEPTGNLVRAAP